MKKYLLSIIVIASIAISSNAQQFVLTGVGAKHALLEEFTGIKCGNCPAGHTEASAIENANPGLVHIVALPPTNSSYTNPSGTAGTDFRRPFTDAFYTSSYCSPGNGSRFMPSAFINRKLGTDGNILQSRGLWASMVTSTLAETPDLNVAVKSVHNATAQTLTVDVQVYYTSNITNANAIYVFLTQDELTSDYQSGSSASASNPYVYKHTFRENISTGQWGDAITGPTTMGSLFTKQYVLDLSTTIDPIDVSKAHVVAFVVDAASSNKEVLNSISAIAEGGQGSTGAAPSALNDLSVQGNVIIYPNPSSGEVSINLTEHHQTQIKVLNMLGETISEQHTNEKLVTLSSETFPSKGIYFIELSNKISKVTKKVVIQ